MTRQRYAFPHTKGRPPSIQGLSSITILRTWQHNQQNLKAMLMRRAAENKSCAKKSEFVVPHPLLRSQESSQRLRSKKNCRGHSASKNFLRGWRLRAASGDHSCERGELVKFRMLTRWYRVGSPSSSLNKLPRVPTLILLLLRSHFKRFSKVHLRRCPIFSWFRSCGCFLACTYDGLRLFPIYLHNPRSYLPEVMLRVLVFFNFLTELPCRIEPHVEKDFPFATCSLHFSHCVVSSTTTSSVCHCFLAYYTFFLILKYSFC